MAAAAPAATGPGPSDAEAPGLDSPGADTSDAETRGAHTPGATTEGAETTDAEVPAPETPGVETSDAETPRPRTQGTQASDAETDGAETGGAETAPARDAPVPAPDPGAGQAAPVAVARPDGADRTGEGEADTAATGEADTASTEEADTAAIEEADIVAPAAPPAAADPAPLSGQATDAGSAGGTGATVASARAEDENETAALADGASPSGAESVAAKLARIRRIVAQDREAPAVVPNAPAEAPTETTTRPAQDLDAFDDLPDLSSLFDDADFDDGDEDAGDEDAADAGHAAATDAERPGAAGTAAEAAAAAPAGEPGPPRVLEEAPADAEPADIAPEDGSGTAADGAREPRADAEADPAEGAADHRTQPQPANAGDPSAPGPDTGPKTATGPATGIDDAPRPASGAMAPIARVQVLRGARRDADAPSDADRTPEDDAAAQAIAARAGDDPAGRAAGENGAPAADVAAGPLAAPDAADATPDAAAASYTDAQDEGDLPPEDEADLQRELAEIEAERAARRVTRQARSGDLRGDTGGTGEVRDISRLFNTTEGHLSEDDVARRRSNIAHLKAAVAARRADAELGGDAPQPDPTSDFREDLERVMRPRRVQNSGHRTSTRPSENDTSGVAPLVLVDAQRVDDGPAEAAAPIRPRRVSRDAATGDEAGAADADTAAQDASGGEEHAASAEEVSAHEQFRLYAEERGVESPEEVFEAAAAFLTYEQGHATVFRHQVLKHGQAILGEMARREEGLRAFGMLLREGQLRKVRRGEFELTRRSQFHRG